MDIPKNYKFEGIGTSNELEFRYWYPDSSVIYISDYVNTLNYEKMIKEEVYILKEEERHSSDTLILHGIDSLGLYWRDEKIGNITIGFSNVPKSKKGQFEAILSTIRTK